MELRWTAEGLPVFHDGDRRGLADFFDAYVAERDAIYAALVPLLAQVPVMNELFKKMTPADIERETTRSQTMMKQALVDGNWRPLVEHQRQQGVVYANLNVPFREWFDLTGGFKQIIIPALQRRYGGDVDRLSAALLSMARYVDVVTSVIGEAYLSAKQKRIDQQAVAIAELSTPVLQLRDRLLLLPIIGILDTQRARQVTENLLRAIRAHRARVVVVDVTGVAAVDSRVANHLLQTVEAARLMGARVVVSGLSPEVATTMVTLGVDLSRLDTVADLQTGLEDAERRLGLRTTQLRARAGDLDFDDDVADDADDDAGRGARREG